MPERLQLRHTAGWRLPDGAVSVARPSRWGSPWRAGQLDGAGKRASAQVVVDWYRRVLWSTDLRPYSTIGRHEIPTLDVVRAELAGRDLACWCRPDLPCHADVLLEAANSATCSACGDCCDPVILTVETWLGLTDPGEDTPSSEFAREHWTAVRRTDERIAVECDRFDRTSRLCLAREDRPPICSEFPYYGTPPSTHLPVDDGSRGSGSSRCSYRADHGLPVALVRKPPL